MSIRHRAAPEEGQRCLFCGGVLTVAAIDVQRAPPPKTPPASPEDIYWRVMDRIGDYLATAKPADALQAIDNTLASNWYKDIDPRSRRAVIRKILEGWAGTLRSLTKD
jgi:hypothetical protein